MMRSSNPALSDKVFLNAREAAGQVTQPMTVSGAANKTGLLLIICSITATISWNMAAPVTDEWGTGLTASPSLMPLLLIGGIGGFIFALITIFKKTAAPITAPIYAALEGLALGAISAVYEMQYPGIVHQAILATFGTLFALLLAYKTGVIKATENFKLGVFAATGGIAILYVIDLVMRLFGTNVSFIHESSPMGILFSVFVVVIAALNLVMDFDFIENGEKQRAPKYMEWYAAFGLMVTLVWLYLEILRLLGKSRRR